MTHTIEFEFHLALLGRDELLGEDYLKTKDYEYIVPENQVKDAIIEAILCDYPFKDRKALYKFVDDHDMWLDLEDEYTDIIDDWLFDECYEDAKKEFIKEYLD